MDLKDRVALVTGASSGIGEAVSRNLAAAGMRLVLTARRQDRLETLAAELPSAVWLAADIVEPDMPQRLLDEARESYGRCDVVINNAGLLEVGAIEEIDLERVSRMVRVNVEAAYRVAYTALRYFKRENRGHLLNVSSVVGQKVRASAGAYAGTKFAIEALTEALRLELAGTPVKVSCVEPGLVRTELHDHLETHPAEAFNVRHILTPNDIARVIRFMLEQPESVHLARVLAVPKDSPL